MPGCGTCPRRTASVSPGETSYDDGPGRCVAVHAEANALLYCDREDLVGATLYVTREPCYGCQKLIDAAGIERVVTSESDTGTVFEATNTYGLRTEQFYLDNPVVRLSPLVDLDAEWWEILEASH